VTALIEVTLAKILLILPLRGTIESEAVSVAPLPSAVPLVRPSVFALASAPRKVLLLPDE
jgi:hypothetical protein